MHFVHFVAGESFRKTVFAFSHDGSWRRQFEDERLDRKLSSQNNIMSICVTGRGVYDFHFDAPVRVTNYLEPYRKETLKRRVLQPLDKIDDNMYLGYFGVATHND